MNTTKEICNPWVGCGTEKSNPRHSSGCFKVQKALYLKCAYTLKKYTNVYQHTCLPQGVLRVNFEKFKLHIEDKDKTRPGLRLDCDVFALTITTVAFETQCSVTLHHFCHES